MKMIKLNLGMKLVFCMWLGIQKYIYLIQSIHMGCGQAYQGLEKVILNIKIAIWQERIEL